MDIDQGYLLLLLIQSLLALIQYNKILSGIHYLLGDILNSRTLSEFASPLCASCAVCVWTVPPPPFEISRSNWALIPDPGWSCLIMAGHQRS